MGVLFASFPYWNRAGTPITGDVTSVYNCIHRIIFDLVSETTGLGDHRSFLKGWRASLNNEFCLATLFVSVDIVRMCPSLSQLPEANDVRRVPRCIGQRKQKYSDLTQFWRSTRLEPQDAGRDRPQSVRSCPLKIDPRFLRTTLLFRKYHARNARYFPAVGGPGGPLLERLARHNWILSVCSWTGSAQKARWCVHKICYFFGSHWT